MATTTTTITIMVVIILLPVKTISISSRFVLSTMTIVTAVVVIVVAAVATAALVSALVVLTLSASFSMILLHSLGHLHLHHIHGNLHHTRIHLAHFLLLDHEYHASHSSGSSYCSSHRNHHYCWCFFRSGDTTCYMSSTTPGRSEKRMLWHLISMMSLDGLLIDLPVAWGTYSRGASADRLHGVA